MSVEIALEDYTAEDDRAARYHLSRLERMKWEMTCRRDLTAWACEALAPVSQVPARHHVLLLRALERVARGECKRLMVCMPPGHAKSTYSSVIFPPWVYAQRPNLDLIGASHGSDLAEDFSSKIQGLIRHNQSLLGYGLASENVKRWRTTNGGFYRAAGVGGSITGRRADGALIDDPVKSAAEAESPIVREAVWQWYQAELYTRLKPGAWMIVIMCMTGDTPVRMADGSERRLDALQVGDSVATYEGGRLSSARVLGWKSQGEDAVYEIRMSSGRAVRANERHPFLVQRGESSEWVRLRNLCPGDRIAALPAENATNPRNVKGSVIRIIRGGGGRLVSDRLTICEAIEPRECVTDTVSSPSSTTRSSRPKAGSARFAAAYRAWKRIAPIGRIASRWTTTTRRAQSAGSCATTVISCSATQATDPNGCAPPQITSFAWDEIVSIVPAGREQVYDVQIERTENFIANGLVSHNTRWNEDDLGGRLLQAASSGEGDEWEVIKLPAICDAVDDPLGRAIGQALWPEWQDEIALLGGVREDGTKVVGVRKNSGPYVWGALWQQDPKPRGASFFDIAHLMVPSPGGIVDPITQEPILSPVPMPNKCDTVFATVDTAIKSGSEHNSTAVTYWSYNSLTRPMTTLILDWDLVQIDGADQSDWLPHVHARGEELAKFCGARYGYSGGIIEDKATGTVLIQQSQNQARREGRATLGRAIDSKLTAMGKEERAIAAAPYVIAGLIGITEQAFNKTTVHKGRSANHQIKQITDFRLGSKQKDGLDLLDTFCYGVLLTCGTNAGDRRGI